MLTFLPYESQFQEYQYDRNSLEQYAPNAIPVAPVVDPMVLPVAPVAPIVAAQPSMYGGVIQPMPIMQ